MQLAALTPPCGDGTSDYPALNGSLAATTEAGPTRRAAHSKKPDRAMWRPDIARLVARETSGRHSGILIVVLKFISSDGND